jgi:hypothetical protein
MQRAMAFVYGAAILFVGVTFAQERPPFPSRAVLQKLVQETGYLRNPSIQKELKLSDEQRRRVEEVSREVLRPDRNDASKSEDRATPRDDSVSVDARLLKILSPEQASRFRQIVWQQQQVMNGLTPVFRDPEFVGPLNLTPEQTAQVQVIDAEFTKLTEARTKIFESNRPGGYADPEARNRSIEAIRKIQAFRNSSEIRLTALLTAEQRTRMQERLGTRFRPDFTSPSALRRPDRDPSPARGPVRPTIGTLHSSVSTSSLHRLAEPSVQEDLQLSPEQVREIRRVGVYRAVESQPLSEAQQLRLRQIYLQLRQRASGPGGILLYSEVVEVLKLSDGQREQIEAILHNAVLATLRRESHLVNQETEQQVLQQVLTAEQQEAWKGLLGEPFEGDVTDRSAVPLDVVMAASLRIPSVQTELRLTDTQAKQAIQHANQPLTERKPLSEFLTSGQLMRLREIHLQIEQRRTGPAAILWYGEVYDPLKLSIEQRAKIRGIRRFAGSELSPEDRATAARLAAELFTDALTADQRAILKTLLGEPFSGEIPEPAWLLAPRPPAKP